jgi:hypothetical protein
MYWIPSFLSFSSHGAFHRPAVLLVSDDADAGARDACADELTKLREPYLGNTQVTDAGVAELKRKLPDLIVER